MTYLVLQCIFSASYPLLRSQRVERARPGLSPAVEVATPPLNAGSPGGRTADPSPRELALGPSSCVMLTKRARAGTRQAFLTGVAIPLIAGYAGSVALHSWCLPLPQSLSPDLADIERAEQDVRFVFACAEMPARTASPSSTITSAPPRITSSQTYSARRRASTSCRW